LLWAVAINVGITLAELVGGLLTGSLALLSDALHNFSDVVALLLAYVGQRMQARPPDARHTYGLGRAEVIAGLINAVALVVITGFIFYEAYVRLRNPAPLHGGVVLAVGFIGLVGNVLSVLLLQPRKKNELSLNVRSAILHLALDALSALGVIAAAAVIFFTGWQQADPLASFLIGILVLFGSVGLAREGIHILMEGAPRGLDLNRVTESIVAVEGVDDVHDLHIWCVSSTYCVLSAHVVVDAVEIKALNEILENVRRKLTAEFAVNHCTLQPESVRCGSGDSVWCELAENKQPLENSRFDGDSNA
jgi:cobalt-zinc-cadmium efflux system protein